MKAIVVKEFGAPGVLTLDSVPDLQPGWEQVLVRLAAVGVNPVETYIRAGRYATLPELPYTPGADGAGTIAALGSGVSGWQVGDRVYVAGSLSGTYAEQAVCGLNHVHPLPERVSFTQGAALGVPYATAHLALFDRGAARAGETVLIHGGTGGVGIAAIQLARAAGLKVLATGGSEAGRQQAREQGAHEVFDHHAAGYLEEIQRFTAGRGVDLIIELLANVNLGHDLTLLATGGRVAIVGSRGPVEIDPRAAMTRCADLHGVMLFTTPPAALASIHAALGAGLANGTLRPLIRREFPLAEAAAAHEAISTPGAAGKIVLLP